VTKYLFFTLFSEVWMKTMVPKYHCRIKKCGVYPSNPRAKAAKAEESLKQQVAMAAKCSKKPTA